MAIELSEQEQLRRQSLQALRELGIEPYPAARYEVTATATLLQHTRHLHVWNVDIHDSRGRLISSGRVTNCIKTLPH